MGRAAGHGLGWLRFFEEVPEPRQKAKVLYPLPELLLCCLVGVLCGAEGWVEVEEYGEAKLDFLRRFLPFDHGIPSHDIFSDVFNVLDPEGFKAAFIAWTATLQENVCEIVAIDGKTLRRSFDRGQGQGPIHMISAWAAGQRLVLGQLAVGAKENEITAIPELLALLSLKGAIVTIDAIGCQKKIAVAIRQKGADYLLALKENRRPSIAMSPISSSNSALSASRIAPRQAGPSITPAMPIMAASRPAVIGLPATSAGCTSAIRLGPTSPASP
jgi:hypothetical protein